MDKYPRVAASEVSFVAASSGKREALRRSTDLPGAVSLSQISGRGEWRELAPC